MQPPFVFDMNAQSLHLVSRHMYVTNIPQITKGLYGIKSIYYVSLAGFKAQLLLSALNLKFCLHAFFQSILVYEDKESYPLQSEMGFYFRERMLLQWCDKNQDVAEVKPARVTISSALVSEDDVPCFQCEISKRLAFIVLRSTVKITVTFSLPLTKKVVVECTTMSEKQSLRSESSQRQICIEIIS